MVLINEDNLRNIMDIPSEEYDIIVAQVDDLDSIPTIQASIEKLMRKESRRVISLSSARSDLILSNRQKKFRSRKSHPKRKSRHSTTWV